MGVSSVMSALADWVTGAMATGTGAATLAAHAAWAMASAVLGSREEVGRVVVEWKTVARQAGPVWTHATMVELAPAGLRAAEHV